MKLPKTSAHCENRDFAQQYAGLIGRPVYVTIAGEVDKAGGLYTFRSHPSGKLENLTLAAQAIMSGVHESSLGSTAEMFDASSKNDKARK